MITIMQNPYAWLTVSFFALWFIIMNIASFERYESDEVWLSFGWPFVCWTEMQGVFITASFIRYEALAGNLLIAATALVSVAYLAQCWLSQFSIRTLLVLTAIVAAALSPGLVLEARSHAIALYLSPVALALCTWIWVTFRRQRHTPGSALL